MHFVLSVIALIFYKTVSKTKVSCHENLQEKLLVPLHFFFLLLLISIAKPWPAEPQGRLPRGSARGTALGLLSLGLINDRSKLRNQGFVSVPFVKTNPLRD